MLAIPLVRYGALEVVGYRQEHTQNIKANYFLRFSSFIAI
jgi:hypothetical protein